MKRILFFVFLLLSSQKIFTQFQPELDWFRIYNGPVNSGDFLHSMKLDNSGIYLAGGSFMDDNTADAFLIKYSLEGDSLYSIVYSLQPNVRDEFNSLAINNNSDLYLTGVTTINNFNRRMILQKYSPSSQLIWSKDFNFKARGLALVLDSDEQPILAYDNWEGPQYAYLVINRFNSAGDSLWAVIFRDDTSAYGIGDLIIDSENYIYAGILQLQIINGQHVYHSYIASIKDGNLMWFKPLEGSNIRKIILDTENNLVAFTKYDSRVYKINPTTGETIWERNVNDSIYHITNLCDLGVDQLNNVIVTGNNSDNNADIQIKKFSSAGEELWFTEYNSQEDLNDLPTALALDSENNIYITGTGIDSISKTYVIKLSPAGDLIWEYTLSEVLYEQLYLWPIIVRDSSLFIGGSLYDFLTKSNIFIMKLDQTLGTGVNDIFLNPCSNTLSQNYPNPFNPNTSLQYAISSRQFVTLKVYDVLGNEVATLINEEKQAGIYEVEFDGSALTSGIYFYRLRAASFVETKKMILLK